MANFSSNEVRHFYVVKEIVNSGDVVKDGDLKLCTNATGDSWFEYFSPNGGVAGTGGVVRTDMIEKGKLTSVRMSKDDTIPIPVDGEPPLTPFPKKQITLDGSLNTATPGKPVAGQKYIFRVRFYGMGVGHNDIQYSKSSGVYTARPGDNAEKVCTELVDLFVKGYKNEPEQWVTAYVEGTGDAAVIAIEAANTGIGDGSESKRPYSRGRKTGAPMRFEVNVNAITVDKQDYPWGIVDDVTVDNPNKYTNARAVCDMEYFYLGERTAQDRAWSYPFNFDMVYVSEPDPAKNYSFIDLEFFYSGDAEDVQRSKKQMTFAFDPDGAPAVGDVDTLKGQLEALL